MSNEEKDFVEIVRCIDCIRYEEEQKHCSYDNPYPQNPMFCMARQPHDYCSYGQKK